MKESGTKLLLWRDESIQGRTQNMSINVTFKYLKIEVEWKAKWQRKKLLQQNLSLYLAISKE